MFRAESWTKEETKNYISRYVSQHGNNLTNEMINKVANKVTEASNGKIKKLQASMRVERGNVTAELLSLLQLYENKNHFVFNQLSALTYHKNSTGNIGFGYRYINDKETFILGSNAFADYEHVKSDGLKHKRLGFGVGRLYPEISGCMATCIEVKQNML